MIVDDLVSQGRLLNLHGMLELATLSWLAYHLLKLLLHEQHAVLQIFHVHGFCVRFVQLAIVLNAALLPQISQ